MGRCSVSGKKGLLLRTNKCFSCGKEVCENCSGNATFVVDFFGSKTKMCSCSQDCLNAFRNYLRSFELNAATQLNMENLSKVFNNIMKDYLAKTYLEFRQASELSIPIRDNTFNRIREGFYRNYNSNLAKNLEGKEMHSSFVKGFDVKLLGSDVTEGRLLLYPQRLVFEPKKKDLSYRRIDMELEKIKDVRFTTGEEISALRVLLFGPFWGALFKKQHNMLTVDVEDYFGIIQHPIFEGDYMETAIGEINEMRRNAKTRLK